MDHHNRSPWHDGERALQRRAGVAERMEEVGSKIVRDAMPEQHRSFFAQLPFVLLGAVDAVGDPWATLLEGAVRSPDPRTLQVAVLPAEGDPARVGVTAGAAVGMLGIELHTRRRNRVNGTIAECGAQGFVLTVGQSFGNCPRYIQARHALPAGAARQAPAAASESMTRLDAAAAALIGAADTMFVASYVDTADAGRQVDVSHRGGRPGFVRVDGDVLTIPDFAGNLQFNTMGNLHQNPRAGLLFVDFASGDTLQLTGSAELVFDGAELRSFQGAERLWRLRVTRAVRTRGALALRARLHEMSPRSLATGSWAAAN